MIRQELTFATTPQTVFNALMQSAEHSAFTGAPAVIDAQAGGAWTAFGGAISGRTIELVPNQRIVQAWRPGNWPEGKYSMVHFELHAHPEGTRIVLEHTGYPDGQGEHLDAGWHDRYWTPLAAWLAS